jgi:RNA polymerase sigma-70 factor (ECF subfamily)
MLRNELDAEDQVQSALCKAWEHISAFERRAKFSTWLLRIVVNECLMQMRQTRRTTIVSLDASGRESLVSYITDKRWPEDTLEESVVSRLIEREIQRIPPLLRNAFLLRDVQGRPMAEVAERLGITVQATKSRLSRARRELRKRLEPYVLEHFTPVPTQRASSDSEPIRKEPAV